MTYLLEIIRSGFSSLMVNKLRTFLTMSGVIIGIATMIGIASLINGINRAVIEEMESLGPNVICISKDETGITFSLPRGRTRQINYNEVNALRRSCSAIDVISMVAKWSGEVSYGGRIKSFATIYGVDEDYLRIAGLTLADGRFFTGAEVERGRPCVIGKKVAETLFGKSPAIGMPISIRGQGFKVIGVLEEVGMASGTTYDDAILIPYLRYRRMFIDRPTDYALVIPKKDVSVDEACEQIRYSLRSIRRIPRGANDTFAVLTKEAMLETHNRLTSTLYLAVKVVSSIALVVSSVGIINIMLVSVMERTREIGLRKAVGATRKAVALQFLVESVILTLTGGIFGVAFGYIMVALASRTGKLPISLNPSVVPLAFSLCCGVGIFSGLYPAVKAAFLDPVEALRYE